MQWACNSGAFNLVFNRSERAPGASIRSAVTYTATILLEGFRKTCKLHMNENPHCNPAWPIFQGLSHWLPHHTVMQAVAAVPPQEFSALLADLQQSFMPGMKLFWARRVILKNTGLLECGSFGSLPVKLLMLAGQCMLGCLDAPAVSARGTSIIDALLCL